MIRPRRLALVVCLLLTGCLIPIPRTAVIRPEGTIYVVAEPTQRPVESATVTLQRFNYGPPPTRTTHEWTELTDSAGAVHFTLLEEREWIMPLMIHGVPHWGWRIYVESASHDQIAVDWPAIGPQATAPRVSEVTIELRPNAAD